MWQMILDVRPDAPPNFDNFLAGANEEAIVALRRWAIDDPPDSMLYLWGDEGTGKTHLLRATQTHCQSLGEPCRLIRGGQALPDELSGLLLVDDVQHLDGMAQIALFNLINQAREGGGRVVVAGNAPPHALSLRQDLTSRLAWGLVFQLQPLSEADRLMALSSRAQARGMRLPDEVRHHLLTHCRRDLPHLLALVDGLDEYSLSRKRPLTLPLAREYLRDQG